MSHWPTAIQQESQPTVETTRAVRKLVLNYAKRHLWKVICEAWKKNKGEGGGVNTPSCIIPPSLFPRAPLSVFPYLAQESLEGLATIRHKFENVTTMGLNICAAADVQIWLCYDLQNAEKFNFLFSHTWEVALWLVSNYVFSILILILMDLDWQMCPISKFYSALVMTRVTNFQWSPSSCVTKDIDISISKDI